MMMSLSILLLSACLGPEGRNGCDRHGNCAGSDRAGTIWHELTNDIHRTDMMASDEKGSAPPGSEPFSERSTWKDFENRIGNKATDNAYKAQGPAAIKDAVGTADAPKNSLCTDTRIGSIRC